MAKRFLLLLLFPLVSFAQNQRTKLDSLLQELNSPRYINAQDTNKVILLCETAKAYRSFIYRDSADALAHQALALAEQLDYKFGRGLAYRALCSEHISFDQQLDYGLRALKIFEQLNNTRHIASTLDYIGGRYYTIDNYIQAMAYFRKAYTYYGKLKDKYNETRSLANIGACYAGLNDHTASLKYQQLILPFYEELGDKRKIGAAYNNMAGSYQALKDYKNAIIYYYKAVGIFKSAGQDNYNYALALRDLGSIHRHIATDSSIKLEPDSLVPAGKNANLAKAIRYLREAHAMYERKADFIPVNIALELSVALEAAGYYQEALKYRKEHELVEDSLFSRDTRLKIADLETKREASLKERQIQLNRVQAANKIKERLLYLLSIGLLGMVIMLIWRNYNRQRSANKRLSDEKVKLEVANKRIAEEKQRSDNMAATLQESLVQKEALATQLAYSADMKTRFLANISHELRTPVTLLTGMLGLMKDKTVKQTAKTNEQLEVAFNNSRRLQYMVEEILDLSRLDTANARINAQTKEMAPLLRRMVYAFETFIENEQLSLTFTSAGAEGIYVQVDEHMLEKIINNLVYNAVKFNTPGGWIKVIATAASGHFILAISNSGSGIRQDDLPHVFERFYQGKTSSAKAQGVGIGLSLVKEFTQQMGGAVQVSSTQELGTTFTLQFPIADKPHIIQKKITTDNTLPIEKWEHFPAKQTVLIVEDNVEMRYYLHEVLEGKVNLAEAENGIKALEWLGTNKADLIISDLMMPLMGGEEFITNLKNNPAYKNIPIITLTALADANTKINLLRLGIDDYIVKPFDAPELRIRVYNLLTNLQERRQFDTVPAEPDDIPIESDEADTFKDKISTFVLARMKTIDVSVYDLAYELGMSERQLYRLSKRLTGCTPAQLIKEVRLQKAYEMLLSGTAYKVEYVAKHVGYDDASYFSRQFLERFGKRPADLL